MIECTYQIVAVYSLDGEKDETLRPVLAWSDTGVPQVLGEKGLVPADTFLGFTGVRLPSETSGHPRTRPVPIVVRPKREKAEETPS